ncbi:MAG TPA: hypothetical protein VF765_27625 [Polyangiaceae bacterium]
MQTLIDPTEIASRVPPTCGDDVASSLVAIDEKLEEDAIAAELGAELARHPGARLRVWCSD